jgi:hypothetical protein
MDIGPINAIRPVPAVRPSPPGLEDSSSQNPDLTGVFPTEFRNQQRDDSYSPGRSASRGLEDENDDQDEAAEPENTQEPHIAASSASISFFA